MISVNVLLRLYCQQCLCRCFHMIIFSPPLSSMKYSCRTFHLSETLAPVGRLSLSFYPSETQLISQSHSAYTAATLVFSYFLGITPSNRRLLNSCLADSTTHFDIGHFLPKKPKLSNPLVNFPTLRVFERGFALTKH